MKRYEPSRVDGWRSGDTAPFGRVPVGQLLDTQDEQPLRGVVVGLVLSAALGALTFGAWALIEFGVRFWR